MAQDIVPLDPHKDKCPWCSMPVLVERQLAVYGPGEDTEQYLGLRRDGAAPDYGLTKQELAVLSLIADGLLDKEIALKLNASFQTIKNHGTALRLKLGTRTRTETAVKAIREGIM